MTSVKIRQKYQMLKCYYRFVEFEYEIFWMQGAYMSAHFYMPNVDLKSKLYSAKVWNFLWRHLCIGPIFVWELALFWSGCHAESMQSRFMEQLVKISRFYRCFVDIVWKWNVQAFLPRSFQSVLMWNFKCCSDHLGWQNKCCARYIKQMF